MSIVKLPQGIFEAGASVQGAAESARIGLIPDYIKTEVDSYAIGYSSMRHFDLGDGNDCAQKDFVRSTTFIEVPSKYFLNPGIFSLRDDFFGDASQAEGRNSFVDVYRKWQDIAAMEESDGWEKILTAELSDRIAIDRGEISSADIVRRVVLERVVELYGLINITSDPEVKAEHMFRAGIGLLSFKDPVRDAQIEEICDCFFSAADLVSDPDAKALIFEFGVHLYFHRFSRLESPGNELVPSLIQLWERAGRKGDTKYDPVRLFAALKWSLSTPDQMYNMRFLLERQEGDGVDAADNLVRAAWAQLKWFHVMYNGGGTPEIHTEDALDLSDMLIMAANIWVEDEARAQHVKGLGVAAAKLGQVAVAIETEHDGSYTL